MKKIGLVGMSNGQQRENKPNVLNLIKTINECGYEVALGDYIYETENYFSMTTMIFLKYLIYPVGMWQMKFWSI